MGILFILVFYFVALSVLALICSVILTACASWYLRGKVVKRGKLRIVASIFPFACVFYAGIWFVAYAAINGFVFHRDPILGDGWYTDIPGGYAIEMIDVTDQGYLHPTGTDINGNSTVQGVRRLQIAGKQIYGHATRGRSIISERTATRKMYSSYLTLQAAQRETLLLNHCCRTMPPLKAFT